MIRANNFLVDVADNNLFLYDVSINPELKTSQTKEKVLNGVIKLHGQTSLGGKLPAYDGRKTLYTSSSLPFVSEELVVMLIDLEKKQRAEREYMITTDTYHLTQFMSGRQMTIPQETNQVFDVVLTESPSQKEDVGEGLECWRGYCQGLLPTQMGLWLSLDMFATPFSKPVTIIKVVEDFLNIRDTSRPLADRDLVQIKKAPQGVCFEVSYQQDQIRRYKIAGITPIPISQLIFPVDAKRTRNFRFEYASRPCLQAGSNSRVVYLPMEVCKIVEGHRYSENLRDKQVSNKLRATCKHPQEREQIIHDKMINGCTVDNWTCLNFSSKHPEEVQRFCMNLIHTCNATGMAVNPHPCVEVKSASPNCIENALRDVQRRATQILGKQGPGTQIPLLIIILPDTSCFHGKIKRVCETDIGMVSYCCLPRHVSRPNSQYLENVALKINVKVGGHNTFLGRSESPKDVIPLVSGKKESPRDVVPTQPYWNQVTEHDLIRDIVTDGQFENVLQVNAIREDGSLQKVIYEVWVDAKVAFIQRDKPATLEHIVHEAMIILNCHPRDIYFCREGRPVPSDKLLVQSCKLVSQFRLRGGFRNDPIPLAVFIDSIKHADVSKWFENITIPFNLRRKHGPKYEIGLGEDASWVLSMVLMAAEHTHEDGLCYAGGFSIKDMWYLPDSRSVEIRAPTQLITQEGYVEDEAFIGSVIDKWFTYQGSDSILHYPMFVEDLIMKIDNLDTAGDEFISVKKRSLIFLHPASKSACERLKIIDALMVHYHKLLHADAKAFQNALCGLNFSWIDKVSDADAAPEMRRRYYHRFWDGRAGKYSTKAYAEDYFGRLDLTRCLITHTDSQVTEKQVDAAIFVIWPKHISDVQERLLMNYVPPSQISASSTSSSRAVASTSSSRAVARARGSSAVGSTSSSRAVAGMRSSSALPGVAGPSGAAGGQRIIHIDEIPTRNSIGIHEIFGFSRKP